MVIGVARDNRKTLGEKEARTGGEQRGRKEWGEEVDRRRPSWYPWELINTYKTWQACGARGLLARAVFKSPVQFNSPLQEASPRFPPQQTRESESTCRVHTEPRGLLLCKWSKLAPLHGRCRPYLQHLPGETFSYKMPLKMLRTMFTDARTTAQVFRLGNDSSRYPTLSVRKHLSLFWPHLKPRT